MSRLTQVALVADAEDVKFVDKMNDTLKAIRDANADLIDIKFNYKNDSYSQRIQNQGKPFNSKVALVIYELPEVEAKDEG